jgi:hypothetical protein
MVYPFLFHGHIVPLLTAWAFTVHTQLTVRSHQCERFLMQYNINCCEEEYICLLNNICLLKYMLTILCPYFQSHACWLPINLCRNVKEGIVWYGKIQNSCNLLFWTWTNGRDIRGCKGQRYEIWHANICVSEFIRWWIGLKSACWKVAREDMKGLIF